MRLSWTLICYSKHKNLLSCLVPVAKGYHYDDMPDLVTWTDEIKLSCGEKYIEVMKVMKTHFHEQNICFVDIV